MLTFSPISPSAQFCIIHSALLKYFSSQLLFVAKYVWPVRVPGPLLSTSHLTCPYTMPNLCNQPLVLNKPLYCKLIQPLIYTCSMLFKVPRKVSLFARQVITAGIQASHRASVQLTHFQTCFLCHSSPLV